MNKKLFALIALLPLTATAAPVIEGVYIGHPSKRLHLESWDYEGTGVFQGSCHHKPN